MQGMSPNLGAALRGALDLKDDSIFVNDIASGARLHTA